jgi:hypothetical protein
MRYAHLVAVVDFDVRKQRTPQNKTALKNVHECRGGGYVSMANGEHIHSFFEIMRTKK